MAIWGSTARPVYCEATGDVGPQGTQFVLIAAALLTLPVNMVQVQVAATLQASLEPEHCRCCALRYSLDSAVCDMVTIVTEHTF